MDYRATELIKQGDALFEKRSGMMNHWQECAEQFYPERADFTTSLDEIDIASNLISSVPVMNRRSLGNAFSSFLRPYGQQWFEITTSDDSSDLPNDAKEWLEEKQKTQRNAMYDRVAGFQKATKETDHDYVSFGNAVVKVEVNSREQAMLFFFFFLRDVAWSDNYSGQTSKVHERMSPSASKLAGMFSKKKLHKEVIKALEKDPEKQFNCRQVVMPIDDYEILKDSKNFPRAKFASIYVDIENEHIIEESPSVTLKYVIPRWQTVSNSQYAFSQAALAALSEARGLQQMMQTILDAGENYVRPPLIATKEAVAGNVNYYPGGITYVSSKYDERTGDPLRPMNLQSGNLNVGFELLDRARMVLREAFFLDKINLPEMVPNITAYEMSLRTKEYIRNIMPLFDPVENDYNAPLCEMVFEEMMSYGFFGDEIPKSLLSENIKFKFKSPLRESEDANLVNTFAQTKAIIADTMQLDPDAGSMIDLRTALRDTLTAVGTPTKWTNDEDEVEAIVSEKAQERELMGAIESIGQAGAAAEQGGKGLAAVTEAMQPK